jgi:transcriptional regulator with XRE-family HTH domain
LSEQANDARKSFGIRLRDLRRDARLSGRALADLTGLHPTKVSRIEHARQNPSEDDIRAWCIACGVEEQAVELIAIHREVEQMWVEYRQMFRKGQKSVQAEGNPLYEQTRLIRAYEAIVVPGILQTPGYVRAVLGINAQVHGLPGGDVEDAVQARLERQRFVTEGSANLYSFIMEASVLTYAYCDMEAMNEQFDFLLNVSSRQNVSLGIIPPGFRSMWGGECFYIFDDAMVRSDMWTGRFRTTRRDEVAFFIKAFHLLGKQAVYGPPARALIERARHRLQSGETF